MSRTKVKTASFVDNAVTTAKIATDAVTSAKIPANAIGSSEIDLTANYTFTGNVISPGQVIQVQAAFLGQGSNYGTGTDPTVGNHTSNVATDDTAGAGVDGDGYWHDHVITSTSQTPVLSNWSVDITPKSATSLIKFEFNPHVYCPASADSPGFRIVRTISGGTPTAVYQPQTNTSGPYGLWYGAGDRYMQLYLSGYDKPATTTTTNYKVYFYSYAGASMHFFGHQSASQWAPKQHFTVMEIAQ